MAGYNFKLVIMSATLQAGDVDGQNPPKEPRFLIQIPRAVFHGFKVGQHFVHPQYVFVPPHLVSIWSILGWGGLARSLQTITGVQVVYGYGHLGGTHGDQL